jgi:hypothetical protein
MAQVRMQDGARLCQDNIRQKAIDQFGTSNVRFDQINTNRNGWVSGMLRVGGGPSAMEHRFSCSVNLSTGYVRSARIENEVAGTGRQGYGEAGRDMVAAGMDRCRTAISDRIRDQGFWNVRIGDMNRNQDGDRVTGFARAEGSNHPQSFDFSCSLDRDTGSLQGTSLTRR